MNGISQPLTRTSRAEDTFACSWCMSRKKRCLDVVLAVLFLIFSAPLQILICIAIKLFSPGPVLFRQIHTGRSGKPFLIYKYRTMEEEHDGNCSFVTRADDPRITRLGGILRRTKLDELPQLINILQGEMSFVGPRPRVPAQEGCLFLTRPGLTGIASLILAHEEKILQRISADAQEQYHADVLNPLKLRYDLQYIETASLGLDIEIMLRTAMKVYFSKLEAEIDLQPIRFKAIKH
jgi:lipopolysaccharide/colanic/teichoic acid biosynthesis glycosyltransferase